MLCWDVLELFLAFIYFGICLTAFIWRLTKGDIKYIFIEYEMWSILLQLIYYILFLLIGFTSIFNKPKNEAILYNFLRSVIFKFIWPIVMSTPAVFYLGYFFEWFKFEIDMNSNDFWLSLFLHGFSQAGFLIDLILFYRDYKPTHVFDFIVISGIYVAYCILCFSIQPQIKTYLFLNEMGLGGDNLYIISVMIVGYFVYLYLYFIYMTMVKIKSGVFKLFGGDEKEINKESDEKTKPMNNDDKEPIEQELEVNEKPSINDTEDEGDKDEKEEEKDESE